MNRKRTSEQINTPMRSTDQNIGGDGLIELFGKITLSDSVDPKTKKVKKDPEQNSDNMISSDIDIKDNIDSLSKSYESLPNKTIEREILRIGKKLEDVSAKINMLNKFIHDQCILKEECGYIN